MADNRSVAQLITKLTTRLNEAEALARKVEAKYETTISDANTRAASVKVQRAIEEAEAARDEANAVRDAFTATALGAIDEIRSHARTSPAVALAYAEEILKMIAARYDNGDPRSVTPNPMTTLDYTKLISHGN